MIAAIYSQFKGPISIENVDEPKVDDHGVVIEIKACGICRSDWHGWQGHDADIHLPHVPGHEFSGIVMETGKSVKSFAAGDRVTAPFCCGCGSCHQCLSGKQHICDDHFQPGFTHWGSMAQFVYIKNADFNLVKLPRSLDFVEAASLGCRFITAYRGIVNQGKVSKDKFVAIHGCGGVGLSAIMIANALEAKVIAIDINNHTLQKAKSLGAQHLINAAERDQVVEEIKAITGGGAHVSMDALGSQHTCNNSISCLAKGGKHLQIGILGDHDHVNVSMSQLMLNELEIIGSHGMAIGEYNNLFKLIEDKALALHEIIDRTIHINESPNVMATLDQNNNTGVVIIDKFGTS